MTLCFRPPTLFSKTNGFFCLAFSAAKKWTFLVILYQNKICSCFGNVQVWAKIAYALSPLGISICGVTLKHQTCGTCLMKLNEKLHWLPRGMIVI